MKTLKNKTLKRNNIELVGLDEVFTQIPSWNMYYLSNYGRLLHKGRSGYYNLVKPSIIEGGYLAYTLSKPARTYNGEKVRGKDGKPKTQKKTVTAQRLVAELYIINPYPACEFMLEDLQAHHKDGVRTNNYFKNIMWLAKSKRKDHDFIHGIKKVGYYNVDKATYYTYKDIEMLLKRIDVNIMEFIDSVRYADAYIQDGKWTTYKINGHYVGIQPAI